MSAISFKNKEIIAFWLNLCNKEDEVIEVKDILDKDISVLEISILSIFKLTINKFDNVGQIVKSTRSELLNIKGFYKPALKELEKELEKNGLALKEEATK
jgi:DNA-directed RNA polymerase alpha subunit